jgi:ASC-1-like (ASCH) protein
MKHILKTWPEYFKEVEAGTKTFEVRKDDRNFKVGDTLLLVEYTPNVGLSIPEKSIGKTITYKLEGGNFGVEKGFCILGIK